MHAALLERSIDALDAVRRHISFSVKIRDQVSKPEFGCKADGNKCFDVSSLFGDAADGTSWKVLDHCMAITRVYALYESFVLQILREYLNFLSKSYTLSQLGDDFIKNYTRGIGQILIDQHKQRFKDLDLSNLIRETSDAMSDKSGYQIQSQALLRLEQNLRLDELVRMFSNCGLKNFGKWIASHPSITDFFASESRLSDTPTSELKQIVDYRNEAAHGDVDNVLGPDVLIEVTQFFKALCKCIVDFVQFDTLIRAKQLGTARVLGVISERYRDDIVVAKVTNATITVGDDLYVLGRKITMMAKIGSIQLNDVPVDTITITNETEVGLTLGVRAMVGCELIRLA